MAFGAWCCVVLCHVSMFNGRLCIESDEAFVGENNSFCPYHCGMGFLNHWIGSDSDE